LQATSRVRGDPDTDPALISSQAIGNVRDRVPELLVLEVVRADLDRLTLQPELAADSLEIPDRGLEQALRQAAPISTDRARSE